MVRLVSTAVWLSLALVIALGAAPARADDAADRAEALRLYAEGREHLVALKYAEAMVSLEGSLALVESPNAALLLGHALLAQGRRLDAARTYERTLRLVRTSSNQAGYDKTREEAERRLDGIQSDLAKIVVDAPTGAPVRVNGADVPTEPIPGGVRASWWIEPGKADIFVGAGPALQTKQVAVERGATQHVTFGVPAPKGDDLLAWNATPVSRPPVDAEPIRVPIAAIVVGVVGLGGMATFAGFGVRAAEAEAELDACGASCPESKRSTAEDGKRDQIIANVALGVGLASTVTSVVLFSVFEYVPNKAVSVRVGPAGLSVAIRP
jgi:hypothetical protein